MNRDHLERLAGLLEDYRDRKAPLFDLRGWGEFQMRAGGFLWLEQRHCNTAACAIGLACTSDVFAPDGMTYRLDDDGRLTPIFRGLEGWDAVRVFFGVDHDQAVWLFAEHAYGLTKGEAAARAVAARIREVLAHPDFTPRPT